MDHINQAIIQGFLPRDARTNPNKRGGQYAMFTVATSEKWIDKTTKDEKSKTQFHSCTAWTVTGDEAERLKKGGKVRVGGKIEYSAKKDPKTGIDRYYTNIVVDSLEFVGEQPRRTEQAQSEQDIQRQHDESTPPPATEDDLPF